MMIFLTRSLLPITSTMNNKRQLILLTLFKSIIAIILLTSCGSDTMKRFSPKPLALGELNEIVIVMDDDMWEGAIGDTLRYYYSSAFPVLPQPESIFDLRHFTAEELQEDVLRRELRNYLIVADLADTDSPAARMITNDIGKEKVRKAKEVAEYTNTVVTNRWADGQTIIYLFGNGETQLVQNLKRNFPAVRKRIHQADRKKLNATVYLDGRNKGAEQEIAATLGINMRVPGEYKIALNDTTIVWLRRETPESSSNIMLRKVKYQNETQLTPDGLKTLRDSMGLYVSTDIENTYMRVNDLDLPMVTTGTEINGNYALEARGIWEIANDYVGGSFVTYAILNKSRTEIIMADGFIHAPGKEKRNFMLYLEHALRTIDFADSGTTLQEAG